MNYSAIKHFDTSDGIGIRTSLFVSGCHFHCLGCFNSVTWEPTAGQLYTQETENSIILSLSKSYINGLSILGGEPFEPYNLPTLQKLVDRIKSELPEKTIWCWTGGIFEDYLKDPDKVKFLKQLDILVDGPFILSQRNISLNFKGSENQRVIDVKKSFKSGKAILSEYN